MKTKLLFKTFFMISLISYCNNALCAEIKDDETKCKVYFLKKNDRRYL